MSKDVLTPIDFFSRTLDLLLDQNVDGSLQLKDVLRRRVPFCAGDEHYALAARYYLKNIEEIKSCVDSDRLISECSGEAVESILFKYEGIFIGDLSIMKIQDFRDEYVNYDELGVLLSLRHMFIAIRRDYRINDIKIFDLSKEIAEYIDDIGLGVDERFQRKISNDLGFISIALDWIRILGVEPLVDATSRLFLDLSMFAHECVSEHDLKVREAAQEFGRKAVQIFREVSWFEAEQLEGDVFTNLLPKAQ
ncbi:hypothetical protein [Thalassobaculum sp.]|uniref:hypothetical protein n=1 Tax=Thalassobaculum sp. TaxID=2022740 RepID=UPI0032EDCBC7